VAKKFASRGHSSGSKQRIHTDEKSSESTLPNVMPALCPTNQVPSRMTQTIPSPSSNKVTNNTHDKKRKANLHNLRVDKKIHVDSSNNKNQNYDFLIMEFYFDGGARGNPSSAAGAGAELKIYKRVESVKNGKTIYSNERITTIRMRKYLGSNGDSISNNVAEYEGLILGLREALCQAKKLCCIDEKTANNIPICLNKGQSQYSCSSISLIIYGDSKLVINQMKGEYQCRSPNLKKVFRLAQGLVNEWNSIFSKGRQNDGESVIKCTQEIRFNHVFRKFNKTADMLANEAIDKKETWISIIPHSSGNTEP